MRSSLPRLALSLAIAAAVANPAYAQAAAPDTSTLAAQARIDALEARVRALEMQLSQVIGAARPPVAAANSPPAADAADDASARADALLADSGGAAADINAAPDAPADRAAVDAERAADDVASSGGDAAQGANGNAFNPAISIILNGSYSGHSLDPDAYARSGFPLVGEGRPSARGFSLGESEISMSANIDEKFYGQLTLAIGSDDGQDEVGIEEAFIDTSALPGGLTLRAGRFFSNIGYLNSHHAHSDKFFDRPLPYQAFLGNQYGDDGVQLRWVAPTSTFVEVGGELLRGQNFPAGGAGRGGAGVRTLFAHVGGDIGSDSSWLAGVSGLDARSEGAEDGFTGDTRLYVADGTWKWAPEGNFKDGGVTLRGEYFIEHRDGTWVDPADAFNVAPWNGTRHGAYGEAVWRINRRWEAGYRYDWLSGLDGLPFSDGFDPRRHTVALTWINSEFSLLRLQFAHDQPNAQDDDNALTLQYQVSLGAHGAHKF